MDCSHLPSCPPAYPPPPPSGLEEELVDCSGGDEISLEAGTQRKLEALMKVRPPTPSDAGAARTL